MNTAMNEMIKTVRLENICVTLVLFVEQLEREKECDDECSLRQHKLSCLGWCPEQIMDTTTTAETNSSQLEHDSIRLSCVHQPRSDV